MYKNPMLTNIFYQNPYWFWAHSTPKPSSESIPNFPFLLSLLPFPPSIAFTQKQNQKARHSCRAQNSQKQNRAQLSCLLLSPLSFPFQPSAKPFGNFPLYFHCFAEYWETQKSRKKTFLSTWVRRENMATQTETTNRCPACWTSVGCTLGVLIWLSIC